MEKTTPARPQPDATPDAAAGWARAALATAMAITPGRVVSARQEEETASAPSARRPRPAPSTRWGPHRHAAAELCLVLQGAATLVLGERARRRDVVAPTLVVVEPGVWHYEACRRTTGAYALLWLVPTEAAMGCSVSRYHPTKGWDSPWRHRSVHPAGRHLHDTLTAAGGTLPPGKFAGLMADLLAVFSDAHRQLSLAAETGREGSAAPDEAAIAVVKSHLDAHLDQPLTLAAVANLVYLSPNHLNALFRRREGCGIRHYLIARRMEKAMGLCRETTLLIKQIAKQVGYDDPLYFSRAFHTWHGVWPSEVGSRGDRKEGKPE